MGNYGKCDYEDVVDIPCNLSLEGNNRPLIRKCKDVRDDRIVTEFRPTQRQKRTGRNKTLINLWKKT